MAEALYKTQLLCPSSRQTVFWPLPTSLTSFSTVFLSPLYTVVMENSLEVLIHTMLFDFSCCYTCYFCLESPLAFTTSLISSGALKILLRNCWLESISSSFYVKLSASLNTQSVLLS